MKFLTAVVLLFAVSTALAQTQQPSAASPGASATAETRIQREVRHELLMMPYYGVFDAIGYKVDGFEVTLFGKVTRPSIKADAEAAVKNIEGVEKVNNQIEVLPPSPQDDRLRLALFRAIYGFAPLQKYELGTLKPIRILVQSGRVTLEGVVDNEADKNAAGLRANGVPGILGQVTNNLQVAKPSGKG